MFYDEVEVWLKKAQKCFDKGDIEKGRKYLIRLCNEYENYEESFAFRDLTDVWNQYKHFVEGMVPPSKNLNEPDENLTDDALLELLLEEVNSGGFDAYLCYNGEHFGRTYDVVKASDMPLTLDVLDRVKGKFPQGEVPESADAISDLIDDNALNFDDEDDFFCNTAVKEFI